MESIGQLARTQGSALTRRPSDERLSGAEFAKLATLTEQMAAAYPHQELGESLEVLLRGYELLALEFGTLAVRDALERALTHQKFFPHPSEIREAIEMAAKQAREQQAAADPWVPCGSCMDSWRPVNADGTPWDGHGPHRMQRCSCFTSWQRRRKGSSLPVDHKRKAAGE